LVFLCYEQEDSYENPWKLSEGIWDYFLLFKYATSVSPPPPVYHSPPYSAEVKECVKLYHHSPTAPSWGSVKLKAQGKI
jgi:hypothetical protein